MSTRQDRKEAACHVLRFLARPGIIQRAEAEAAAIRSVAAWAGMSEEELRQDVKVERKQQETERTW